MNGLWIWVVALVLYGAFWFWHVGLPRPLTQAEVDAHMATIAASGIDATPEQLATLRAFLEADDGHEFFMLNLADGCRATGESRTGRFRMLCKICRSVRLASANSVMPASPTRRLGRR